MGLDIIGDRLTEINVTAPTCVKEIEAAYDISITGKLFDAIDSKLSHTCHTQTTKGATYAVIRKSLFNRDANHARPFFKRAVTYICEHNRRGAMGLVINQPIDVTVGELLDKIEIDNDKNKQAAGLAVMLAGP